jgi:pimeloyl-ACP methyl ester carboxylesterase
MCHARRTWPTPGSSSKRCGPRPALLIGQSLGGHTALLVAAARPDLVRALVLADAGPAQGSDTVAADLGEALRRWPVPFASRAAAVEFFGGPSLTAEAWADGLEHRDGGWWPRFDVEVMVRTLREAVSRDRWRDWERIRCPVLVARAGDGVIPAADARAMAGRLAQAQLVELPGAAHDLHLDRPVEWRQAVSRFLDSSDP